MKSFNTKKEITYIPIQNIIPNPYQPRKIFSQSTLTDLAESIKKYGVLEPICVRYVRGTYEIIAGERRLIASKKAGLSEVPCIINNITDKDSASIALIENIQRENLNFFEEAEGYQNLMVNFGYTQEEISKIIGKKQSTISNKMRLLKLPKDIKTSILENNLSERHARALLKIENSNIQREVLEKIIKYGLNITKTEEFIEKTLKRVSGNSIKNRQKIKGFITDLKIFTNTIKSAVDIMKESGVATDYSVTKMDNGYEINIKVCM